METNLETAWTSCCSALNGPEITIKVIKLPMWLMWLDFMGTTGHREVVVLYVLRESLLQLRTFAQILQTSKHAHTQTNEHTLKTLNRHLTFPMLNAIFVLVFNLQLTECFYSTVLPWFFHVKSHFKCIWLVYVLLYRYGVTPENIILYGQSIGTVPTIDLAARYECAAVILHSPLMSGLRVAFPDTRKTYCFDAFPRWVSHTASYIIHIQHLQYP